MGGFVARGIFEKLRFGYQDKLGQPAFQIESE